MRFRCDLLAIVVGAGLLLWLGKAPAATPTTPSVQPPVSHNGCVPIAVDGDIDSNGELAGGG